MTHLGLPTSRVFSSVETPLIHTVRSGNWALPVAKTCRGPPFHCSRCCHAQTNATTFTRSCWNCFPAFSTTLKEGYICVFLLASVPVARFLPNCMGANFIKQRCFHERISWDAASFFHPTTERTRSKRTVGLSCDCAHCLPQPHRHPDHAHSAW